MDLNRCDLRVRKVTTVCEAELSPRMKPVSPFVEIAVVALAGCSK